MINMVVTRRKRSLACMVGGWIFLSSLWCGFFIGMTQATFNLYLKPDEMKRAFGLSKELYYVREGVLNEYALNFVVVVPDNVTQLHLTWESVGPKPLPYSSSIEISDSLAMEKPTLNISSKGLIPTFPETFQISLTCTGIRSEEVRMELTLNVTTKNPKFRDDNDLTTVIFKRKKICLSDPKLKAARGNGGGGGGGGSGGSQKSRSKNLNSKWLDNNGKGGPSTNDDLTMISEAEEAFSDNSNIIYIIVGSSLGLVVILVILAFAAYFRTRKGQGTAESNGFLHVDTSGNCSSGSGCGSGTGTGTGSGSGRSTLFIRSESPQHHYSSVSSPCHATALMGAGEYAYSSFQPSNGHYAEICPSSSAYHSSPHTPETNSCKLAEMTIQRCKVRLQSVIMEGTFAMIYKGTVLERDGSEEKVIVKTVTDHSSPVQMALLLHEGLAFVSHAHKNVHSVVGVAAEERVPPFLIYPDDGFRNLKGFLLRTTCRSGPGRPITAQEIVHMAIQIAGAIAFLHRHNVFFDGEIATRNAVVDDKLVVKISDSALSKDLFPDDYQEGRPIKWISPEAILTYSRAGSSDLWSFGVFMWEISSLGKQPYTEIDHGDLLSFLKMGYRLSQPINCPDELYSSMTRCWTWNPDDRPKWTHLRSDLESLRSQLSQYV